MCNVDGKKAKGDSRNCTFEMRGQRRIKTELGTPCLFRERACKRSRGKGNVRRSL